MVAPKVLLVTPDFPPATGGIAVLLDHLARHAGGWETRVLTLGQAGDVEFDAAYPLGVTRVSSTEANRHRAVAVLNATLVREVLASRPDLLLSGHVVASVAPMLLRRPLRVPLLQYVHADEFRVRPRLTRRAVRTADATVAVSSYTRGLALAAGGRPDRVRLITPGVELPSSATAKRGAEPPTILTVASLLSPRKGHDVIVRALPLVRESVPGTRWVVIGDGPLRSAIEAEVRAAGLEGAVSLLGRVADSERDRWLDRANVFCMPSRIPQGGVGGEGFGIVYLEAGAHGLPVVGGNVAGALDAVVAGETGLLVDPTDHRAVAGALVALLSDPDRAQRMGEAGRRNAEAHAWPRIAALVEGLAREILSARGGER